MNAGVDSRLLVSVVSGLELAGGMLPIAECKRVVFHQWRSDGKRGINPSAGAAGGGSQRLRR